MKNTIVIIAVFSTILFFFNVQSRDFWAPDEGDFAEIVREMDSDSIVPHLNGKPYGEKPPLFYYMTYLSKKIFFNQKDEFSLRVPTSILAILFVLFVFLTIQKFSSPDRALYSTLMLISSPLFYWQARYLQIDMVFSVFTSGSLLLFYWYYNTGRFRYYLFFFIFLGLAFMAKGPLAMALTVPAICIYLIIEKRFSFIVTKQTWLGILILIIIILPWYIAIYMREGFPYLYENVIHQNITRFFDAWSHKRPFYYYLTTLPLDFFPWSLFLPAGIYTTIKYNRDNTGGKYFLIWFFWMFLFLSFSSGKISKYMLPSLPALCFIGSLSFQKRFAVYNKIVFTLLSLLFFALGIILLLFKRDMYPEFSPERELIGLLCIASAIATYFLIHRKKEIYGFLSLFALLFLVFFIANTSVYTKLNHYKSPRPLCEKIKTYTANGAPWVYYGSMRGVYVYYIGSTAVHVDEHKTNDLKRLENSLKNFYILTRKRDLEEIMQVIPAAKVILEEKVGNTPMVFIHIQTSAGKQS